jgi:carbamoyl-phosphate synthase / aspartate carbamoyltransferase / dihydroorotase
MALFFCLFSGGLMLRLPGLIDPHVHMREPGATHKEDWLSGTSAALAGGFTLVLAMPNTTPAVVDGATLDSALSCADAKAVCDYAQFLGANLSNIHEITPDLHRAAGVKMYLDQTFGSLRLEGIQPLMEYFEKLPSETPLVVHAEGRSFATTLLLADLYRRPVHIAHVSRKEEITLIRKAKERGIPVTCEVTAHHLFLDTENARNLSAGRREVRPVLASPADRLALWQNLDVIDCFASDHAPHTAAEKDGVQPPPGFPGLETSLPLFLTAVHQGKMDLDDLIERAYENPRRIFHLPRQAETWVEVDEDQDWQIPDRPAFCRAGWTPFAGWQVKGRIERVILRGQTVYQNSAVLADGGYGQNVRDKKVFPDNPFGLFF